jgi:drug/metabolite transporter (DMT)-like permease
MNKLTIFGTVLLCSFLGALGQICLAIGMKDFKFVYEQLIHNWQLFAGLALYGISMILYLFALKQAQLTAVYPIIALSYLWVMILGFAVLKEPVNSYNIIGAVIIIAGVGLITFKGG